MKGTVTYARQGALGRLVLASANGLNVLDRSMREALRAGIAAARQDIERGLVQGVVLSSGSPRAFSAGADLREVSELEPETASAFSAEGQALTGALATLPVPTAALVDAPAFGGGIELALACDFRLAAPRARFHYQAAKLGILPGWGGTQRLGALVGLAVARRMLLLGEPLDAEAAAACGLTIPHPDAGAALAAFAETVSELAPAAVAGIKRGLEAAHPPALEVEREAFAACFASGEAQARIRAFLSRTKPAEAGALSPSSLES